MNTILNTSYGEYSHYLVLIVVICIITGKRVLVQELDYEAELMRAAPELDDDSVLQRCVSNALHNTNNCNYQQSILFTMTWASYLCLHVFVYTLLMKCSYL